MDIVDEGYFEDYDKQSLLDGAADGLLSGLGDPYTFYYTPEEYAKLWEDDEGEYAGVVLSDGNLHHQPRVRQRPGT